MREPDGELVRNAEPAERWSCRAGVRRECLPRRLSDETVRKSRPVSKTSKFALDAIMPSALD